MSHRVCAVLLPGVVLMDLAAPAHVFGHCGAPEYRFEVAAERPGTVRCSSGLDIAAPHGLEALRSADTVVVPGTEPVAEPGDAVLCALRAAHARGARLLSVCTGAFVLARAGLLDGRRAATHWAEADRLATSFPRVAVDPTVLYVDEGDVLTSAGVAAGLDLCLHVVRTDHGAARAAEIARRTVVSPHREGGQAQFVERPLQRAGDERGRRAVGLQATRDWALTQLDRPLTVAELAAHGAVSPRTFARRFAEETGTTPAQWLLAERTRAAQELLEHTDLPVEEVARRSGFGTSTGLRRHLRRRLHTTPTAYRRAFRTAVP